MICTFYSFKGGVGRSMALANVADLMAREGLRVLMIDFDLEAPGLEQFFQIDQRQVRKHEGLMDLLLSYKQSMSREVFASMGEPPFKRLKQNFIVPLYEQLPGGGRLDLLPAGQRDDKEQLARYALSLRTFDWEDFYYNWAGASFFEWMRRTLVPELYDVVLVDSRTGVTEMGGICAYQLADIVVMMCASNYQNVEGVRSVAENFFSSRVQALRRNRPLQAIIVPARVEQRDPELEASFRDRFEQSFNIYLPSALLAEGLTFWDLRIPYEPRYAFEERVVARPARKDARPEMADAFQNIVRALALLAEPETALARLAGDRSQRKAVEPQYDVTRQSAGYDLLCSSAQEDQELVGALMDELSKQAQLHIFQDRYRLVVGPSWQSKIEKLLFESQICLIFVGQSGPGPWQSGEARAMLERCAKQADLQVLIALLPGAQLEQQELTKLLERWQWVDLRPTANRDEIFKSCLTAVQRLPRQTPQPTVEHGTPYLGLRPFEEQHASVFFGREELIERLIEELRGAHFLAVIGSSGSGKSSLVQAGLFPALRRGGLPGSDTWFLVTLTPGAHPLARLASTTGNLLQGRDSVVEAELAADEGAFYRLIAQALAGAEPHSAVGRQLLLFVDQFEELVTLCAEEPERQRFIDSLLYAATAPHSPLVLVLALRSDFLGEFARYRELAAWLQSNLVMVARMTSDELRKAIELPAQQVGMALESGLVERILHDVENEPGALPLLEFLLLQLWERRRGGWLTNAAYSEIGGVQGALAWRAEEAYARLTPAQQAAARRVLLRLIQPGQGSADTRRRTTLPELLPAQGESADVEAIVKALADARLLVTSQDERNSAMTVELAHDALIQGWPRLRDWIEENRTALSIQRRLTEAAMEWTQQNRDASYLYHGLRLAQARAWADEHAEDLNELERDFLETSGRAEETERRAFAALDELKIANQAAGTVYSSDGTLMVTISADGTAQRCDLHRGSIIGLRGHEGAVTWASFSPDNRTIVTAGADGKARLWDCATGRPLAVLGGHTATLRKAVFSPDGSLLVIAGDDHRISVWNAQAVRLRAVLNGHNSPVIGVGFSPDGRTLITSDTDGATHVWDAASGELLLSFPNSAA
jgi:cellulose biosynthesis protein BcsQ